MGVLACVLATAGSTFAQGVGASGAIRGTATDPAGAAVPKATVVAEEPDKAIHRTAVSNENGQYELDGLPPATYQVTIKAAGFQAEVLKDVVVSVGQVVVADFRLKLSSGTETVEVTGALPVVETERGHQANAIDEQYIDDLPIPRRDYLTFTLLAPAVTDSTRLAGDQDFRVKQTPQSGLSFYGSNGRGNSVTVDGGEANDDSGGVRLTLSQDAVDQFEINRSNYTAELGGASGATINIVSRAGSNKFYGTLFGFFRNDALDAADPFAISQALQPGQTFNPAVADLQGKNIKNSLSRQQFGGAVGFPIRKGKTFLFGAFEGLRENAQNAVPILTNTNIFRTTAAQNSVTAALATEAGNPNVPCLTPPGQPVVTLPAQTCAFALQSILTVNANPGPNPFVSAGQAALNGFAINELIANGGVFPYNTRRYQGSVRLDHHFNDQNQLFLRYNYSHDLEESPDVQSLTGFSRGSSIHAYDNTVQAAWSHLFSLSMQNALAVQFNYSNFDVLPNVAGEVGLDIPGYASLGNQIFIPSLTIMRRPSITDSFTINRGKHSFKFGGEFLYRGNHSESHTFFPGRFVFGNLPGAALSPCMLPAASPTTPNPCGLITQGAAIDSLQSVSIGVPQFYEQGFGNPVYDYPRPFTALFAQDTWKITPGLTLNFGVRYELDSQYGPLGTDKDNFAPRVSFAWDPFNDHKTVIRGGYGIFYSQIYGQIADVIQTLGNVNNTRQIANLLAPASINAPCAPAGGTTVPLSACIFQTLFAEGKVSCTAPAPGTPACITAADLTQFGITVSNTGPLPLLTVIFSGQPNYQSPYSQQASIGIERQIGNGLSVALSGIYSHTLRLPVAIDVNAVPQSFQMVNVPLANGKSVSYRDWYSDPTLDPLAFINPAEAAPCAGAKILQCFVNPGILQADQYSSQASALYEGGIIEVKKRFSNNFTLLSNYTYSKGFDTSTDFNSDFGPEDNTNLSQERGLSDFDQRHKFVFAAVVDSPWKNAILSGFELAPIVRYNSGHPFNLLAGADVNGDRHSTNDRPIGAGRNTGLGPDYTDFDMRLSRQFKLAEKANLLLIAEGFNIANHTNFASVNNIVGLGFGLPTALGGAGETTFHVHGTSAVDPSQPLGFTSAFPKRQIQLGVRLTF